MKRRKAKYIETPATIMELEYAVQSGIDDLYSELRYQLMDLYQNYIEERRLMLYAREQIGTRNHDRIFLCGKVPSLKEVCFMAKKLEVSLVCRNFPYKNSGATAFLDYSFERGFDHIEFLKWMETLHYLGTSKNSPEVREIRRDLIMRFRKSRSSVRWDHLIAFSAACGYQLECRLEPVKKTPDGCLTPSKKAAINVNEDSEEYQALLRRLNYPN